MPPITPVADEPKTRMDILRGIIEFRSAGTPDDDTLAQINRLARSPLTAEDLFVFDCVPSTDRLDSYYTRMAESSLANYATDALSGVALMNSHRTSPWLGGIELPIGRTFYGEVQASNGSSQLFARAYLLRDYQPNEKTANTDTLIRGIQAGVISDLSIGFKPGRMVCSICSRNYANYQDCPHFAGARYDGDLCFVWIEDAHLSEVSLVYDGATPGAAIRKAEAAAEMGILDSESTTKLENLYQVRLARRFSVPDLSPRQAKGGEPMKGTELLDLVLAGIQQRGRQPLAALDGVRDLIDSDDDTLEAAAERLAEILSPVESDDGEENERIVSLERQIGELEPLAAVGRQYRADLIESALASGVRVFGNEFQSELHRQLFERATLEEVKAIKGDWERLIRDKLGPGGRQTRAPELPGGTAETRRPTGQYRG